MTGGSGGAGGSELDGGPDADVCAPPAQRGYVTPGCDGTVQPVCAVFTADARAQIGCSSHQANGRPFSWALHCVTRCNAMNSRALSFPRAAACGLLACGLVACGPVAAPDTPARARPAFAGEIVYKRLLASDDTDGALAEVAPVRYFVSGPRWKHCALDGSVLAEYFPDRNVVEFPGPLPRSVDAAISRGAPTFAHLDETKRVLGRKCAGVRKTAPDGTMIAFYDPDVFVEPSWYPNHHFGDWTELLSATKGALPLWWRSEANDVVMVFEAVHINEHAVSSELWGARCPPRQE